MESDRERLIIAINEKIAGATLPQLRVILAAVMGFMR